MQEQQEQRNENLDFQPNQKLQDLIAGYNYRLWYDWQKRYLDLEKQQMSNEEKIRCERQLQDLRVCYQAYARMLTERVYCDMEGEIIFAIESSDGKQIIAKKLLNVSHFRSIVYETFHPDFMAVLEISWGEESTNHVRMRCDKGDMLPKILLKKLNSRGVFLMVSGRTEKKASEALLAYAFCTADKIEILRFHGWGKYLNGMWHYAGKDEITMKEMLKNE